MRSSSEVKAVRVRNPIGQETVVSQWHAMVPGYGAHALPPGTACGTGLTGSLQWETWEGVMVREGGKHAPCFTIARDWVSGLQATPGPIPVQPDREPLAAPGKGGKKK